MTPILVRNQIEWDRLAPVLEKLGYKRLDLLNTSKGFVFVQSNKKTFSFLNISDWCNSYEQHYGKVQTVDEYLQANPLEIDGIKPDSKKS